MKAIQMTERGGPEVLTLVDVPAPLPGLGQVLIRVTAASVNSSDVMRRRGDDYPTPSPFTGAEVSGTAAGSIVAGLGATLMLTQSLGPAPGHSIGNPAAAGGVGSHAVQIAELLGASPVIAGASTAAKREVPVSRRLPLTDAADAHRLLHSGATTGKLVLKP